MRVLLAGATGYIGQAVLRELVAQGHEVVALVRPGRRLSLALSDEKPNQTLMNCRCSHRREADITLMRTGWRRCQTLTWWFPVSQAAAVRLLTQAR